MKKIYPCLILDLDSDAAVLTFHMSESRFVTVFRGVPDDSDSAEYLLQDWALNLNIRGYRIDCLGNASCPFVPKLY